MRIQIVLFASFILLTTTLLAQPLSLATRNKPATFTIVRPAQASDSQKYAAEELQAFTEKMTGVKLPISTDDKPLPAHAILLGNTSHTTKLLGKVPDMKALGTDGFRIKTLPNHLLIVGSDIRGTLYGVYELLEQFGGCRWYSSWHSVIPTRDTWVLPDTDITGTPAFDLREPFWFDMFNGDLAARNKCNGNAMRLTARHGGHAFRFGGGLGSCHTFNKLCPPELYFKDHPEYFSEIDGKRIKDHTQLCLTNPDVLRIVTSNVLARIRKDPGASFYGVSQNDWRNNCTCPKCKAIDDAEGSHAGTMIAFVNKVAEAVEKEFPDVIIETLAYQYTRKPPKSIRPRHNVMPCLCTIECDFSFPLAVSPYKENRAFVDDIRGWSAISPRLYVWDYTTDFRSYVMPFPNILALQENVKFFQTNSVNYLFEQGAYQGRHGDFAELKAWLLAKWLWNPDLPQEELLQDFFNGYYGAAAPYVRTYFDALHSFYRDPENQPLRIFDNMNSLKIPDEFFSRAFMLWQQAEAAVKDSPALLYNVRMGAIPVRYAHLERQTPNVAPITVWLTRNPKQYDVPDNLKAEARELLARFKEAGDIRLSESMERHSNMLEHWQSLLTAVPPDVDTTAKSVMIEDTLLYLGRRGTWGDTVKDPLAEDGSAMKLYNTHFEWCTSFRFSHVAFDPGTHYKIRMRVRVEKEAGKTGEAFWSGIYDTKNKKSCGGCVRKTSDITEDYTWYDVAEWIPERAHYFWIGPGRFDKNNGTSAIHALYIDKLELIRLD
ncbi:MAG: DUF4838 domain-containing protein [Kiritimatiellae bacterium]|nr:DUF4838 domain-containing protein [Kiritimatiellia bacterium]